MGAGIPRKRTSTSARGRRSRGASRGSRRHTIIVSCDTHPNPSRAPRFHLEGEHWTPTLMGDRPTHITHPAPLVAQIGCQAPACHQVLLVHHRDLQAALGYLHHHRIATVTITDLAQTIQAINRPHPAPERIKVTP